MQRMCIQRSLLCDLNALPKKGIVYFPSPCIWPFELLDQENVAEVTLCKPQNLGFKRWCNSHSYSCGMLSAHFHVRKSVWLLERRRKGHMEENGGFQPTARTNYQMLKGGS